MKIYNRQQCGAGLHQRSSLCSCQLAYFQMTRWDDNGKPDQEYWNPQYYHLQWDPRTSRSQFRVPEDNEQMQDTQT